MTPEQEDALVANAVIDRSTSLAMRDAIRLAIRTAYAKGREDAAKVCENYPTEIHSMSDQLVANDCAAAIRGMK